MSDLSATYFQEGKVLLIDKPLGWTSFDVVNKIRYAIRKSFGLKKIKVGHAGTLDPLASGLLIVCTGKATKSISEYMGQEKEYTGTFTLGATTPSYDLETAVDHKYAVEHVTSKLLEEARQQFIGEIEQIPPIFSAVKMEGRKAYNLARKGEEIHLPPRKVFIHEFHLVRKSETQIDFRVVCSKGTYIRSLAYDLGKALHSGAHLSALRRTRIGAFIVNDAIGPLEFTKQLTPGE